MLILGGTAEALELARELNERGVMTMTSLAGRTRDPVMPVGEVRLGGFGGADGLDAFLRSEGVPAVVDATHPFATAMTAQARAAAASASVPYLRLARPDWSPEQGDRWHLVDDMGAAVTKARILGRRIIAAIGRQELGRLRDAPDLQVVVRSVEPPGDLPAHMSWRQGRGPFAVEDEVALLRDERIEVVLARASGGSGSAAKLEAARRLGLPVVLIRRPAEPDGVQDVAAAVDWVLSVLAGRSTCECPAA
ncbi:MAG: cobalt-precorrin-6A reductase [Geminicoccaceae bacterium]